MHRAADLNGEKRVATASARWRTAIRGAALATMLMAGLAPAARAGDAEDCANTKGTAGIAACTRVIKSGGSVAWAYYYRAVLRESSGDLDGALEDFNRSIELDPQDPLAYLDRGGVRFKKGDFDAAIRDFTRAIELDPQNSPWGSSGPRSQETSKIAADAYANRGTAKAMKGDHNGALADYNRAIEIDSKHAGTLRNRGHVRVLQGDHDGALADLSRAIDVDPQDPDGYKLRGFARAHKGDLDSAISDFNVAIKLRPGDAGAYYGRGGGKAAKSDFDGAIADYNLAIKLDPNHVEAYIARAEVKRNNGDVHGAIADSTRAVELDAKNAEAYAARGNAKRFRGDWEGAISDFNRALELNPNDPLAYDGRGWAKSAKGDLDAAIADFSRSIELGPTKTNGYRLRGWTYLLKGESSRAASDFARSREMNFSPYTSLWLYLARARANQNGEHELAADMRKLDAAKWPAPLMALYLDEETPESLLAAAKTSDAKTERAQTCGANFFLAEWYLLKNNKDRVVPLLRSAAEQCPMEFIERDSAVHELKRLGAGSDARRSVEPTVRN